MDSDDAARAARSEGRSDDAIYARVASVLAEAGEGIDTLVDVGCGRGGLFRHVRRTCQRYVGCDLLRYDGFPDHASVRFVCANLNAAPFPLESGRADAVVAVEVIEHLENPRAFMRELLRLAKPGGLVVVTTPNQASLLSKLTLVVKDQFNAFQEGSYPAHITALLPVDLLRIAGETGLRDASLRYTDAGRVPFTARHWPAGFGGKRFSDNVLLVARAP
jgi:2-polyprenyl-3-methyl-5-hydroxy-6-metoxy-1,4-benzoquinol methylase